MGAPSAFSEKDADFSGINSNNELFISKVIHQAVLEVNEQGTEAAAATAVVVTMKRSMMIEQTFDFVCNRPFLFIIHDTTNDCILFMGKYSHP